MSKYIELEDAIEKCKTIAGAGYKWLSDLPTIEVSEDSINRKSKGMTLLTEAYTRGYKDGAEQRESGRLLTLTKTTAAE